MDIWYYHTEPKTCTMSEYGTYSIEQHHPSVPLSHPIGLPDKRLSAFEKMLRDPNVTDKAIEQEFNVLIHDDHVGDSAIELLAIHRNILFVTVAMKEVSKYE